MISQKTTTDPIARTASDWVARSQQGLLSAQQQAEFAQWSAASPEHQHAVEQAEYAWVLAGALRDDPEFSSNARKPMRTPVRRRLFSARWAAGLAAAAACCAVWLGTDLPLRLQSDYYSATGEAQEITLPDGSQVSLGSGSALVLRYDTQSRRVQLLQGEAIFKPAPVSVDEPRAFVVTAAGKNVKALGTEYVVRVLDDEKGWLGVLQHSVALTSEVSPDTSAEVVSEGQNVWFDQQGITPANLNVEDEISWRQGMLIFRREPLFKVVERLNQYRTGQVLVLGEELNNKQISAAVPVQDVDRFLQTLERELGAKSVSVAGLSLLY